MYTVDNPAGRLVTFRISPPVDDGNAASAAEDLRRAILSIDGPVIVCTDLTGARTFAPPTAQRFIELMKLDNSKVERSALLLGAHAATIQLQIERMVHEAANPARATFRAAAALHTWLTPLLTPTEQSALTTFLSGLS